MGRLLVYTVTNTGIRGRLSPPIKEKRSEICKQKWKMVSAYNNGALYLDFFFWGKSPHFTACHLLALFDPPFGLPILGSLYSDHS